MRIHIQNDPADTLFTITEAQWSAALARAGEGPHTVSIGDSEAAFRAALPRRRR